MRTDTHLQRPSGRKRQRAQAGITVLEALWVTAIIGILAALAIPGIARSTGPHRVVREAHLLHAALTEARTRATVERREYRFVLDDDRYRVEFAEGDAWHVFRDTRDPSQGIGITLDGQRSATIVFKPHGWVQNPGRIVFDDTRIVQEVEVLASGLVRWVGGASP